MQLIVTRMSSRSNKAMSIKRAFRSFLRSLLGEMVTPSKRRCCSTLNMLFYSHFIFSFCSQIRRSEELRKEAGKAGDEQLKAYGFLHFSDDGIHSDHISDDGIHSNHISNSLSEPKVSLPRGVLHNVQSRVSGLHGLKSVYGMPDGSPASEPLRPRLEWNGRGIPRFQGP